MDHILRRQDAIAATNASTVPTSMTAQPDQIPTAATPTKITCMLPNVSRTHNPAVTLTQNAKPEPDANFNPNLLLLGMQKSSHSHHSLTW